VKPFNTGIALKLFIRCVTVLLGMFVGAGCSSPPKSETGTNSTISAVIPARPITLREAALIEHKGLSEFSPETNAPAVDPLDKQLAQEMMPVLKLVGDSKNIENNKKALSALSPIIQKHQQSPDSQLLRAILAVLVGSKDYASILTDIDNASRLLRSSQHKGVYNLAEMAALRAKVSLLAGNPSRAMMDLESILRSEPTNATEVFNTGGVKPDDAANPTALSKQDLDNLVTTYPNDYRTHMFLGLFYLGFTTYGEQFYAPALDNLRRASSLNHQSALVQYFLGIAVAKKTFLTKAAASDISDVTGARGGYIETTHKTALGYFMKAVDLDVQFTQAHAQVAESLYSLKRYPEAISSYDKVIELDPNNAGAYNDRGLAKTFSGDHYGAITDFSKAIEMKSATGRDALTHNLENRANAYVKIRNYDAAISDFSRAIGRSFAATMFVLSLKQIRGMYPEFADITDHDLLEGLREKYFPNFTAKDFANNYTDDKKPFEEFVIAGLYVSRGDAYLGTGHFRKAAGEYARANRIYSHATEFERWKVVSRTPDTEFAIDIQTLDFSQGNVVSLWLKVVTVKSHAYHQDNYQIECPGRRLRTLASTTYDANDNVIGSGLETAWGQVAPETIGEMLYSRMCK
jgi:tetratricopeptide (TPR) repeat protein